jgi:N-carbamoylputrescine amidase
VSELDDSETGMVIATWDLDLAAKHRAAFGFFRDRRPQLYARLAQDI